MSADYSPAGIVLRNASLVGLEGPQYLEVRFGKIQSVVSRAEANIGRPTDTVIDLAGRIVLPGLVNAHAHLDKTLWGAEVEYSSDLSINDLIARERVNRSALGVPDEHRVLALMRVMVGHGTTHIRTHTDIDPDIGVRAVETVLAASELMSREVTVEQVAFPQSGILTQAGTLELMEEALQLGVGTVGGLDPAGIDLDPVGHLDAVFALAEKHRSRVDIHLHDSGALGLLQIALIAERTKALSMQGQVAISHGFALGQSSSSLQDQFIDLMGDAGISLHSGVGFNDPVPPVRKLAGAGVMLALGTDGVRDQWSPYGSGDMLERSATLAYRSAFKAHHDIELAVRTVTTNAAATLGIADYGLRVGSTADLVVLNECTLTRAVLDHSPRYLVMKAGKIVAVPGQQ